MWCSLPSSPIRCSSWLSSAFPQSCALFAVLCWSKGIWQLIIYRRIHVTLTFRDCFSVGSCSLIYKFPAGLRVSLWSRSYNAVVQATTKQLIRLRRAANFLFFCLFLSVVPHMGCDKVVLTHFLIKCSRRCVMDLFISRTVSGCFGIIQNAASKDSFWMLYYSIFHLDVQTFCPNMTRFE